MKKTIAASLAALILASSAPTKAQNYYADHLNDADIIKDIDPTARLGVLGVNLALNGTICGITALVKKRDGVKDLGQCFAGTLLQYAGMEMGAQDIPALPGFGLRTVETGTSIINNTLEGDEPFEKLQYGIGPTLIEINTKDKDVDFYWRMLPVFALIYNNLSGHKFSIEDTLNYQTPVFHVPTTEQGTTGLTTGNVFYYDPKHPSFGAHEFLHVLQYERMRPFQLVIPKSFEDFEDKVHLRLGEDLATTLFFLPSSICIMAGTACGRYWWNLIEAEAYTMQTAYDKNSLGILPTIK